MCGVYLTNKVNSIGPDVKFLSRGPDHYQKYEFDGIKMSHSLLSLTGEFTPQPIEKNGIYIMFNGQIYNYDSSIHPSDGYFILDEYLNKGLNFWKNLDGEYSIVIYDSTKNIILFCTDIFGTKPLYYSNDKDSISVASLITTLKNNSKPIVKCKPNTIYSFDLNTKKLQITENYYKFDLTQNIDSFDTWNEKFIKSVDKRFNKLDHDIVLPLSSGHDSGAIACALEILGISFYSYSIYRHEHVKLLSKRILRRLWNSPTKTRFRKDLQNIKQREKLFQDIKKNCDPFFYGPEIDSLDIDGQEDPGAIGLYYILDSAKKSNPNIKIVASGQGGDEIYSSSQKYTFDKPNPYKFDQNLSNIFPWQNFFYGTQISYLSKEESIGGSFGLETRYPFLDKYLVQEYLNLSPSLKNKSWKSPITNFLDTYKYPYLIGTKISGFNP